MMKVRTLVVLSSLMAGMAVQADRPRFNDKEAPTNLDDFREIQSALQLHLDRTRAATICLEIGDGSGSAVIISEDGLVLTAAHVTGGVDDDIKVKLEDGTEFEGVSLGLHSETDSAMLQILGEGPFPFVEVDMDDTTLLGDWVFSLGHSGGFDQERGVNVRVGRLVKEEESTIQSDCPLIGGDSGGPLFNLAGQLIGIHSRVGQSKEDNRHVPIREFQDHWEELKGGKFIGEGPFAQKSLPGSGFLGLIVEDEEEEEGLRVMEIWEGGVTDGAGIKVGDLIVEIAGEPAKKEFLTAKLAELGEGDKLKLKWISAENDEEKETTLKLGERP